MRRFNFLSSLLARQLARQQARTDDLHCRSGWSDSEIIARIGYHAGLAAAIPQGMIDLTAASASDSIVTEGLAGGSAYSWSGGILVSGATRLRLPLLTEIARAAVQCVLVAGVFRTIGLGGSLGGTSRPRWTVGLADAGGNVLTGGVAYDGGTWEVANEYGGDVDATPPVAPSLQSVTTVPDLAVGVDVVCGLLIAPHPDTINTNYCPFANITELDSWAAKSADSLVFDWPATELVVSCIDPSATTTPTGLLTELMVWATEV